MSKQPDWFYKFAKELYRVLSKEDLSELINDKEACIEFIPYEREDATAEVHGKVFSKKIARAVNEVRKVHNKDMTEHLQRYLNELRINPHQ